MDREAEYLRQAEMADALTAGISSEILTERLRAIANQCGLLAPISTEQICSVCLPP